MGVDRVVFRGSLRRLDNCYYDVARKIVVAKGMEEFLWQNGVLFKHNGDYVKRVSERVKKAATKAYEQAGQPVIHLRAADAGKEECARRVAAEPWN